MKETLAELLNTDKRIQAAIRQISGAVLEYSQKLHGVQPARDHLQTSYAEAIKDFEKIRGGQLFYPYLGSGIGNGPLVELADGSVKYDFISGIGVHYFGHSHTGIIEASLRAAFRDTVMQGNLQQEFAASKVSELLLRGANQCGANLEHCFLTSSGAMANENAWKIIFQKKFPADRILAFSGSFAGRTNVLAQITDKPAFRVGLPRTIPVDYIPFYDPNGNSQTFVLLEKILSRYPGQHAAMLFELVQGEGGFKPGDGVFFQRIMDILKKHGILVFVDEIQTFGRTPTLFAFQHFGLSSYVDIVTVAKATQVAATLFTAGLNPKPGLLSQTFTSATSALYSAEYILENLLAGDFFGVHGRVNVLHNHFVSRLDGLSRKYPDLVSGPFGIGAMICFTFKKGEFEASKNFLKRLFTNGAIAFYAGSEPTRIRFLIPVGCTTPQHIDDVVNIIEATLIESSRQEQ